MHLCSDIVYEITKYLLIEDLIYARFVWRDIIEDRVVEYIKYHKYFIENRGNVDRNSIDYNRFEQVINSHILSNIYCKGIYTHYLSIRLHDNIMNINKLVGTHIFINSVDKYHKYVIQDIKTSIITYNRVADNIMLDELCIYIRLDIHMLISINYSVLIPIRHSQKIILYNEFEHYVVLRHTEAYDEKNWNKFINNC